MNRILFICHGNICRSPMGEFILRDLVEKQGMTEQFQIDSAATSTEEIWGGRGNPVYPPAQEELRKHGIGRTPYTDFSRKRAVQLTCGDYLRYDYLLCADSNNLSNTLRILGGDPEGKVKLLLDYAGRPGQSIADPWYTDNFALTYRDLLEGCRGLLEHILNEDGGDFDEHKRKAL